MPASDPILRDPNAAPLIRQLGPVVLARETPVRIGAILVEPALRRILHDDGREEIVEPRVMEVFVILLRMRGNILSRIDLAMCCWEGRIVGDDAVNRVLSRLRRIADGIADNSFRVETITKVGYRLVTDAVVESAKPRFILANGANGHEVPAVDSHDQHQREYAVRSGEPDDLHQSSMAMTNLSPVPGKLVGREVEIATISTLMKSAALVTVVGTGGVGKTRVSLEVGHRLVDTYEDGVWFVELASITDPILVADAIARAMHLNVPASQNVAQILVERLRRRQCLLILDNCEHLIDTVAGLAETIMMQAPGIRLLATSQELLGIEREQAFQLQPLTAAAALSLFSERASGADAQWVLGPHNHDAAVAICKRLDGVPLAIEMAAARAPSLGCDAVLERLDHRFRILTSGRRTALPRHRSLLATLDWSHNLLSPRDAAAFRRLSVFAGGFTLESAAEVAGDGDIDSFEVVDALASLVGKSLIAVKMVHDHTRYALLETARVYAQEKLAEANETDATLRRLAESFATLAQPVWSQFIGHTRDSVLRQRYLVEFVNFHNVLDWAFGDGNDPEIGLRLIASTACLWDDKALKSRLDMALPLIGPQTPPAVRATLLASRARVLMRLSPPKALEVVDEAITAVRESCDDPAALCDVLASKGFALWLTGQVAAAQEVEAECARLMDGMPTSRIWALAMGLKATLLTVSGEPHASRPVFDSAVAALRSFGAYGQANYWQSTNMRYNPAVDVNVDIENWRSVLARIRPSDTSSDEVRATVTSELARRLARRGSEADLDEAIKVAGQFFKIASLILEYRFLLPMALVAIKTDRVADAAMITGFADMRRREAGEMAMTQRDFDELWELLNERLNRTELAALVERGAALHHADVIRLAMGEEVPESS
jgi:predicted ATPase/DNA-binding winged helix-turn-helix (wHTH) protein